MRILCFLFLFLTSCHKESSLPKKTIHIAFQNNPLTFDPRKTGEQYSTTIAFMLYDGLMKNDAEGNISLALAKSYEVSDDLLTYTFHLKTAFWSDGHLVTAHDFEYAWKTAVSPTFACLNAHLFYPIRGAEEIKQGKLPSELLGVTAKDEKTLIVSLKSPTPHFLKLICFCSFFPIPSHIAKEDPYWDQKEKNLVVNGPYKIESFFPYHELSLSKNPSYWNQENVKSSSLKIHIIQDPETSLRLFEKREIDWMGTLLSPIPDYALKRYVKTKELKTVLMLGLIFVSFNTKTFPFHNTSLRQALSLAIPREDLYNIRKGNLDLPANRFLPSFSIEEEVSLDAYDLEKAKALFLQAEKELGKKISSIRLLFQGVTNKDLCQYLKSVWESAFPIEVKLEQLEYKSFFDKLTQKNYDAALYGSLAQVGDPIDLLERFKYETGPKNYAGWENEAFTRLLEESSLALNEKDRMRILAEAEKILIEEMPVAPLFHINYSHLSHLDHVIYAPSSGIRFEEAIPFEE